MPQAATTRRALTLLFATLTCLALLGSAQAANAPVEPYAGYQPQTACAPKAKPGTQALGHWVVQTYGGGYGRISQRARAGRSPSTRRVAPSTGR